MRRYVSLSHCLNSTRTPKLQVSHKLIVIEEIIIAANLSAKFLLLHYLFHRMCYSRLN